MEHPKIPVLFLSYYNQDLNIYPIKQIAKLLEEDGELRCIYWHEDLRELKKAMSERMYEEIEQCDIFILFCSPNTLNTGRIIQEYNTAESLKKTIIPVFIDERHIPDSLEDNQWVRFNPFEIKESISVLRSAIMDEIYDDRDIEIMKKKIDQYENGETYIERIPSENREYLDEWSEDLKDLLEQNLLPENIEAFLRNMTPNQEKIFLNLLLSQLPPFSLDIIHIFCKWLPEGSNKFFSDKKNYPILESILTMNDSSSLKTQNLDLADSWDLILSKKWPFSYKDLTNTISQIFSLNEEVSQNLVNSVIIPNIKFIDDWWRVEADSEQEREQLINQKKERIRQEESGRKIIKRRRKLEVDRRKPNAIKYFSIDLDFNTQSLRPNERNALAELEIIVGKIPKVDVVYDTTFGFVVKDNNIVQLGLSGKNLMSLPENIWDLTSLTKLNLRSNQLTSLPDSIGNLTSLRDLNLWYNKITSLPDSIGNLNSLKKLNLLYNQITSLPKNIGDLTSLRELNLSFNQLTSLPKSIGNLTSLVYLDLRNNRLTSLPENIGNLTSIREIDLNNNLLTSLPESISGMAELKELYLGYNRLNTLPESISGLTSLRQLDIMKNKIKSLPESVLAWFKKLEENGCWISK